MYYYSNTILVNLSRNRNSNNQCSQYNRLYNRLYNDLNNFQNNRLSILNILQCNSQNRCLHNPFSPLD